MLRKAGKLLRRLGRFAMCKSRCCAADCSCPVDLPATLLFSSHVTAYDGDGNYYAEADVAVPLAFNAMECSWRGTAAVDLGVATEAVSADLFWEVRNDYFANGCGFELAPAPNPFTPGNFRDSRDPTGVWADFIDPNRGIGNYTFDYTGVTIT